MSKFNKTNTRKTTNRSGWTAYTMNEKEKLMTQVLTTFFNESKFYGDTSNELVQLAEKLCMSDPLFVANLAVYARKEMHLRSVSHVLSCVVAHVNESKKYIGYVVGGITERADDITETLACYIIMYGKPIPNGLKKALGRAMNKFTEYEFSKYNGKNKSVKFKDVLRICHPVPFSKLNEENFKMIVEDSLPIAKRWETELSARGNNKEVWEELIEKNRIGYMAMLRNLRNILNASPSNIQKVYDKLSDKNEVLRSKQLPFRFLSAYQNLPTKATSKVRDVLEEACEHSISNLPKLPGKTVIAIDMSYSMTERISNKSDVRCSDIAMMLGLIANKICEEAIVYVFNDGLEVLEVSHRSGILYTAMNGYNPDGGTDLALPIKEMLGDEIMADRLIMLSDNEINRDVMSSYFGSRGFRYTCQKYVDEYRKTINPLLWVHAIDLQGYGTQQFIGDRTNIIAGWSERVFEFILMAEKEIHNQVEFIENLMDNWHWMQVGDPSKDKWEDDL